MKEVTIPCKLDMTQKQAPHKALEEDIEEELKKSLKSPHGPLLFE